ncbi:hypothetical protein Pyn_22292 [Prunus yedoensis var. nudiflora]|uniref:Uncharacterized protein n=1 Tax=Prunus yedoensis var. nudiflora TaxID=2094558 RepID=A0A314ZQ51_PRUYE|nr:hypothetical protein Pyn_22292 [Prunus yedoensis var. nudiflora]
MSALGWEVAIKGQLLLLLWIGIGVGTATSNLPLPTTLTRFRSHPPADPAAALFGGVGTTLALVRHTCPGTTGLFI